MITVQVWGRRIDLKIAIHLDQLIAEQEEQKRFYLETMRGRRFVDRDSIIVVDVARPEFEGLRDAYLVHLKVNTWDVGVRTIAMVHYRNSTPEPDGSHEKGWLWVPVSCSTAHEAIAWTFGMKAKDYRPVVEA